MKISKKKKPHDRVPVDELCENRDRALLRLLAICEGPITYGEEFGELEKALDHLAVAHTMLMFDFVSSFFVCRDNPQINRPSHHPLYTAFAEQLRAAKEAKGAAAEHPYRIERTKSDIGHDDVEFIAAIDRQLDDLLPQDKPKNKKRPRHKNN